MKPSDQYREYWAYLRHIETVRMTFAGLLATVAATLLAVVNLQDTTVPGTEPPEGLSPELKASVLLFLALFVTLTALFLVLHKVRYDEYFDRARELEPKSEKVKRSLFWRVIRLVGPFEALLLLVVLVQCSVAVSALALDTNDANLTEAVLWTGLGLTIAIVVAHVSRKIKRLIDGRQN